MLSWAALEYPLGFGELLLGLWKIFVFRLRIPSFPLEEFIPSVRQPPPSTGVGQLVLGHPTLFPTFECIFLLKTFCIFSFLPALLELFPPALGAGDQQSFLSGSR